MKLNRIVNVPVMANILRNPLRLKTRSHSPRRVNGRFCRLIADAPIPD
jgi:hypothetical protein